jgi:mycoredoxin
MDNTAIIKVYGTQTCDDCIRTKKLFSEYAVDYEFIDIAKDPMAAEYVLKVNNGAIITPVILLPDGKTLSEPSNQQLIEVLHLQK